MRRWSGVRMMGLGALTLVMLDAGTAPAEAFFGDTCRDEVIVTGREARSHRGAIDAAIAVWQPAATRRYGRRFADYGYSGERQFSCTWNGAGTRYRCTLSARPCGRK